MNYLIEEAARTLVEIDVYNLQDLGKLYTCFENIAQSKDPQCTEDIHVAATAAIALLKRMMLDDTLKRELFQEILSKTVSTMQQRIRPGVEPDEYPFPEDLFCETGNPCSCNRSDADYKLPSHIDEAIFNEFLNDQDAVLERLEANLLVLEKIYDAEQVNDVRRIFHTLKGEAAIFELNDIHNICHKTEDLLQNIEPPLPIDTLLQVSDWLKSAFACLREKRKILKPPANIFTLLEQTSIGANQRQSSEEKQTPFISSDDALIVNKVVSENRDISVQANQIITTDLDLLSDFISEVREHIEAIDTKLLDLEKNPHNPDLINAVFRVFHTIKGAAGFLSLSDISSLAHTTENLLDLARKGELVLETGVIDVVFLAVDEMKKLIKTIEKAIAKGSTSYEMSDSLHDVIERIHTITKMKPTDTLSSMTYPASNNMEQKNISLEGDVEESKTTLSIQHVILATQDGFVSTSQSQKGKLKESIKVDSENLDKLIDTIGELVIIESMIKQDDDFKRFAPPRLQRTIAQMDKITRELQQLGMSLRMIPVKGTFQKMARVVRDLAKKSGKDIDFIMRGENTMLDKSVVDRIGDPLIHLVRNAVDHGIEPSADERIKLGKNPIGTIELTAFHKGGNIYIEIQDDGRGLNKNLILEKAKQKGLLRETQNLNDREIFNLIFLPGFSTAEKVTDISGRGVGMDVVKRTIEDLRGNIDIESEEGRWTKFSLRLPLTLAIIDGMLVRIGDQRYIIPTLSIVEAVRPKQHEIVTVVNRGEMLKLRERLIPLFRLSNLFGIENAIQDPTQGIVIVVEESGKMTGLLVDELLGQQSTVIKSLGAFLTGLVGISGGSIMSDGKVGIIIDVAGIIKLATSQHKIQLGHKTIT